MKITLQQLPLYLKKHLAPVYLIHGDEILLIHEAASSIITEARQAGFTEQQIFYIESNFNWDIFLQTTTNFSLFAEKTIIKLHLDSKLTETGSKILQKYVINPPKDKLLIIVTEKLDGAKQKTAWFKALDNTGITIPIWPIENSKMPTWVINRLQKNNLKTSAEGIKILIEYAAGNLLALAQEIEKLKLTYKTGTLTIQEITTAISDNAKFNVFNFIDIAFSSDAPTVIRVLQNLKQEGVEPSIILWAIARELRTLSKLSQTIAKGKSVDVALREQNIWSTRLALTKTALAKYTRNQLEKMLQKVATIDLMIKGAIPGNVWNELERVFVSSEEKQV